MRIVPRWQPEKQLYPCRMCQQAKPRLSRVFAFPCACQQTSRARRGGCEKVREPGGSYLRTLGHISGSDQTLAACFEATGHGFVNPPKLPTPAPVSLPQLET